MNGWVVSVGKIRLGEIVNAQHGDDEHDERHGPSVRSCPVDGRPSQIGS